MNDEKDIKEVLPNDEDFGYEKQTPWTSIDAYYKGFHIKKSIPSNKSVEAIKMTIDEFVAEGLEPSWNSDTNVKAKSLTPIEKEVCQHPEDSLERKISHSEKNNGKAYMQCTLCRSFVRWA